MVRPDLPAPSFAAIAGIVAYVEDRVPPGDFLYGVLTNDLAEAAGRADADNALGLVWLVIFVYNNVPAPLWGTREKVGKHVGGETPDRLCRMAWSGSCSELGEYFEAQK